jgi:hypothetical protein
MVQFLQPALTNPKHGVFLLTCYVHMVENVDGAWNGIVVGGRTMNEVFKSWWERDRKPAVAVDAAWSHGGGAHGGNPSCVEYGPVPSWPSA